MQVILHCGVYSTDMVPLLDSLKANEDLKLPFKTQISDPEHIRIFLRKLLRNADVNDVVEDTRHLILDVADIKSDTQRIFLSNPAILGTYRDFEHEGMLFPNVTKYLSILKTVFKDDDLEICFAMRNPATLLSSVLQATRQQNISDLIGNSDPTKLLWSEMIKRIRAFMPDLPITVWYNEDSPLIWRSLLQHLLRLPADADVKNAFQPVASLLSAEDLARFQVYIKKHPGMTLSQERRVIATFIDKFVSKDALEESVEIEGWSQELVDNITRVYEADQKAIAGIPNVTLILP